MEQVTKTGVPHATAETSANKEVTVIPMTEPKDKQTQNQTDAVADGRDTPKPEEVKPDGARRIRLRLDAKDPVRERGDFERSKQEKNDDGKYRPTVLFEDNHLLVVVKPQNVPTQGDSSGDKDFQTMLKEYLVDKYNKPGEAYLGLLHRLDRPTGGVMAFAKTSKAAARLSEQIRSGEFEKTYAAVVCGRPNRTGLIEHYLLKDEKANTVTVVPSTLEGAKRAVSDIKLIDGDAGMSLVTLRLLTGRTHQARVQLRALGSPIAGDRKYAQEKGRYINSPHLALWAYKLVFAHPTTGDIMTFLSEPPREFPWTAFDTDSLVAVNRPIEHGYGIKTKN